MKKSFTPLQVMIEAFRKAMCDTVAEAREKQRQSMTQEREKEGKRERNL